MMADDVTGFDAEAQRDLIVTLVEMAEHENPQERRLRELALNLLRLAAVRNLEEWQQHVRDECRTAKCLVDVLSAACSGFDVARRDRN